MCCCFPLILRQKQLNGYLKLGGFWFLRTPEDAKNNFVLIFYKLFNLFIISSILEFVLLVFNNQSLLFVVEE